MESGRFDRLEGKVDRVLDRVGSIDVTIAAQHEVLKEHVRRSLALEQIVLAIKGERDSARAIRSAIYKFVGGVTAAIALLAGVSEIVSYLKGIK